MVEIAISKEWMSNAQLHSNGLQQVISASATESSAPKPTFTIARGQIIILTSPKRQKIAQTDKKRILLLFKP